MNIQKKANAFTVVCIVFILMLIVSTCCLFVSKTKNIDEVLKDVQEDPDVIDGEGNDLSNGKYPLPENLIFRSSLANSGGGMVTLQAKVLPIDAENKELIWETIWANPTASWALEKKVLDYLSFTQIDNLSAEVACFQPFGERIIIKVISKDNPSINATCTVDYMQRITKVSVDLNTSTANMPDLSFSEEVKNGNVSSLKDIPLSSEATYSGKVTYSSSVYTKEDSFASSWQFFTGDFLMQAEEVGLDINSATKITESDSDEFTFSTGHSLFRKIKKTDGKLLTEQEIKTLYTALRPMGRVIVCEIVISLTGQYSSIKTTLRLLALGTEFRASVSSVEFDSGQGEIWF